MVPTGGPDDERRGGRHAVHKRGRRRPTARVAGVLVAAVAVAVAGGVVAGQAGWISARSPAPAPSPSPTPSGGTPKPSVTPSPTSTVSALWQLAAAPAAPLLTPQPHPAGTAPVPTAGGLASQLAAALADPVLAGDAVSLVVSDPAAGKLLLNRGGSSSVQPASTAKLAVATAALEVLGPRHRFTTRVVELPAADHDEVPTVVLVGGSDPTLAGRAAVGAYDPGYPEPARLSDLAAQTVAALRASGVGSVAVGYDASLFAGPGLAPGWKPTYLTEGDVAPVSALEVDEGQTDLAKPARAADPAAVAGADFAALLQAGGITVARGPSRVTASSSAKPLASVESPSVSALVERMLGRSDNDVAEALARQVALASGQPASFAGGAAAVRAAVGRLGVDVHGLAMVDASGLSTSDRVWPSALVQLLDVVVRGDRPELAAVTTGLPVAGFYGTLDTRYTAPPALSAAGRVRAKTGTLDGVVTLAGYLDDSDGRMLVFALMANGVKVPATTTTERALDRVVAGLAGCGCR